MIGIESVRSRLTLFYVVVLAAALLVVGGLIYVLLARALYTRIDDNLRAVVQMTTTSLGHDLAEGQDVEDAARSTAAELSSRYQMLAIYDSNGRLLAEGGRDDDLDVSLPALDTVPDGEPLFVTVLEAEDDDDRHRLAVRRVSISPPFVPFLVYSAAGTVAWTAALAYAGVVLQANFRLVGDYLNVATNVLLVVPLLLLARRYVNCWRESGR